MKLFRKQRKRNSLGEKTANILSGNSKFAIVEGYKIARTNIIFSVAAEENNCFAITSWAQGEGKSTAAVNLSISFAKMGKKVLLIDCDLRRPNIHNLLKLQNQVGVSELLCKMTTFDKCLHKDVIEDLDVISSGTIPPNPSELIGSQNFRDLIKFLKSKYDYIILDTPPIGVVADTLLLKDYIAGYVFVVRERSTSHGDIEKAIQSIKIADSKILGFLKVGCSFKDKKYYHNNNYGYYKYY